MTGGEGPRKARGLELMSSPFFLTLKELGQPKIYQAPRSLVGEDGRHRLRSQVPGALKNRLQSRFFTLSVESRPLGNLLGGTPMDQPCVKCRQQCERRWYQHRREQSLDRT